MKILIPPIFLLLCVACSQDVTSEKQKDAIYGGKLLWAGFLQYADSLYKDSLKTKVETSFDIYGDEANKLVHVDAEELAEFQFEFFLPKLNKILSKRGFNLNVGLGENYQTSNEVFLNGEKIQLYTQEDIEKTNSWDKASRTFFRKLNGLLKQRKNNESFFLLYSDNDLHAFLLTDEQLKIIADRYKNEPKEIPYQP